MDEYNKSTKDKVHAAVGLTAGAFLLYEAAALMGAVNTKGTGGGGGGPPVTYIVTVKDTNGNVLNTVPGFPTVSTANAWVNANIPGSYGAGVWYIDDSNGNHVSSGSFGRTFDHSYYYVTTGTNNVTTGGPYYDPGGQAAAVAYVNTLPSGTFYRLFQVNVFTDGSQEIVQLASGTKA